MRAKTSIATARRATAIDQLQPVGIPKTTTGVQPIPVNKPSANRLQTIKN